MPGRRRVSARQLVKFNTNVTLGRPPIQPQVVRFSWEAWKSVEIQLNTLTLLEQPKLQTSDQWRRIITLVCIITKSSRCSIVNDVLKQESIVTSETCPNQKHCRQGTHVVCQYYDRSQLFGPRCEDLVKVEFTPNMIHHILTNINYLRENIATGMETGKYDEVLPRAYGLMKLKWDQELAFSAQVLANQCLGDKEDECRATDRFPNPSQIIGIFRYKYPNWEYLKTKNTEKSLDEAKLIFAVDTFLRSAQISKKNLTIDNIMNSPPLNELVDVNLKNYLNFIHGGATHIGCGVSDYSSKINDSNNTGSKQNIVQIVCNFSDALKHNQPVYNILPPIPGLGYTKRCGCQKGYRETRNCLCERELKNLRKGLQFKNQLSFKKDTRRSMKNHSNIEQVSSGKEEIEANGQPARHIISKSRDVIVLPSFGKNLLLDTKATTIQALTFSECGIFHNTAAVSCGDLMMCLYDLLMQTIDHNIDWLDIRSKKIFPKDAILIKQWIDEGPPNWFPKKI